MLFEALIVAVIANHPAISNLNVARDRISFDFEVENSGSWADIVAVPIDGDIVDIEFTPTDSVFVSAKSGGDGDNIKLSRRFTIRNLDLRLIRFQPYRTSGNGKAVFYKEGHVEIRFSGTKYVRRPVESIDMLPLYRSMLLNGDVVLSGIRSWSRGGYLIIAHDSLVAGLEPLVRWKRQMGYDVRLVPLSAIGSNPTAEEIKAYVRTVYETWDAPLTYLLLVGDNTMLFGQMPTFTYHDATDDAFYGMLEGNDYLPEIMVGRIAVDNLTELRAAVAKVIAYESNPLHDGDAWLEKALMIAGVYVHGSDTVNTTKLTKLRIMRDLEELGFQVDTVFWNITHGGSFTDIVNSINSGVSVVNYRGWSNSTGWVYPQFYRDHIQMLNNGYKLPVMFSISCGTGNFASTTDPSFGEAWIRAGTPSSPKGGPAFLGPSDPFTHTKWNNAIDAGIFDALYHSGIRNFRTASTAGLMNLLTSFPDYTTPGMEVEFYFHVYTVLGDPSLAVWTGRPGEIQVNVPNFEPHVGSNSIAVSLNVDTACVSAVLGDSLIGSVVTFDGTAELSFDVPSSAQGDWVYLTVSAPGYVPSVDSAQVTASSGFAVESVSWQEVSGNGDGEINPGETFEFSLRLRNVGTSTLNSPTVTVTPVDTSFAHMENQQAGYSGNVGSGEAFTVSGFRVRFADTLPDRTPLTFRIHVSAGSIALDGAFEAMPSAPFLAIQNLEMVDADGDGYFEPGEDITINITLKNVGHEDAQDINVCLGTHPIIVPLTGCANAQQLSIGDSTTLTLSFRVREGIVAGRTAELSIDVSSNHFYASYHRWIGVGVLDSTAVVGPDCYGYWLYEPGVDVSIPEGARFPIESWIELVGDSGATQVTFDENGLSTVELPDGIELSFYGQRFDTITISRYGWIAMGRTDLFYYRNWPIPSPTMPNYLIAPFWDHLTNGEVLYYHDAAHGLFIVEWHDMRPYSHPDVHETFEAVFNLNVGGSTPIMFIYNQISDVDSAENFSTIGIGSREADCGLVYRFAGHYASQLLGGLSEGKRLIFAAVAPDSFNYGVDEGSRNGRTSLRLQMLSRDRLAVMGLDSESEYKLLSIDGRVMERGKVAPDRRTIDISNLRSGVYILRIGEENLRFVKIR